MEELCVRDAANLAVTYSVQENNSSFGPPLLGDKPALKLESLTGEENQVFLRESGVAWLKELRRRAVPLAGSKMRLKDEKRSENENNSGRSNEKKQRYKKKRQENGHAPTASCSQEKSAEFIVNIKRVRL
jgi:hypothetical protein